MVLILTNKQCSERKGQEKSPICSVKENTCPVGTQMRSIHTAWVAYDTAGSELNAVIHSNHPVWIPRENLFLPIRFSFLG